MASLQDFIDYFLNPYKTGYDIPKTLTYAALFIIGAFLIWKLLKKLKLKIDERLAIGISPYIIFGGILRVLEDAGILASSLFVTPGIYFFVTSIVIVILFFSLLAEKKKNIPYFKIMFAIGLIFISFSLPFLKFVNFEGFLTVLVLFLPWVVIFYLIKWSNENKIVSLIHLFDATTTYVSINFFGYIEQHILPTFLIQTFSPISFIFAKLIVIVTVLVLIDRFCEDKEFGIYLKLIIGILGAGTASRDFIRLIALV